MTPVDLIVMDVDGTLLDSCGCLREEVKRAVQAAADAGIALALGTGRVFDETLELLRELPGVGYTVNCTGASVYDVRAGKEIFSDPIPMDIVREIYARVKDIPGLFEVMAEGHVYTDRGRLACLREWPESYYLETAVRTRTPVDMEQLIRERTEPANKVHMFFPGYREKSEAARRTADLPLTMLSSIPENYEFNMPTVDKGVGLKALAAYLGISTERTMALGDNTNDAGMLREAGYPVLMANCSPEVLPLGKYMTGSCDECGAAQALRAVLDGTIETMRL